jgi:hypothetical protein
MPKSNLKIIYSLRVHIALQQQGFCPVSEMKNPNNPKYNCWVYLESPELLAALDSLMEGGGRK